MSVDIILKHSNQAGKQPDAGSLKQGELAINTNDVKAYIKNSEGQVAQIAGADTGDGRYVKLEGNNTPQEITGNGGLKTEGLFESEGVRVNGGTAQIVENGMWFSANGLTAGSKTHGDDCFGLSVVHVGDGEDSVTASSLRIGRGGSNGSARPDFRGIFIDDIKTNTENNKVYGIYSTLTSSAFGTNFNFYAANSAPNFFSSSTYIGGTTAEDTFELWKSTLTEEQLEQFKAGNVAVPANVSTPGDGEFARAWYYDRQDEETQALLDSGERKYPTPFAAATFTDTFDLGVTTNINLNNNGLGEFKEGVNVSGGRTQETAVLAYDERYDRVLLKSSSIYRGFAIDPDGTCSVGRLSAASLGAATFNINKDTDYTRAISVTGAINLGDKSESYIGINNQLVPSEGATDIAKYMYGFSTSFDSSQWTNDASAIAEDVISFNAGANHFAPCTGQKIAFRANNANVANAFNFYAEGSAPNYYKGSTYFTNPNSSSFPYSEAVTNDGAVYINCTSGSIASSPGIEFVNSTTQGKYAAIFTSASGNAGSIKIEDTSVAFITNPGGGFFVSTDSRLLPSTNEIVNATETIKALNPKQEGFIAHELQAHVSEAVTGTQNETEAVGTLTDYNGTVLQTEVPEPSAEELTYTEDVTDEEGVTTQEVRTKTWETTGERDVYQGVDQTKLIPLLTKALQEALERIEALEAAAAG